MSDTSSRRRRPLRAHLVFSFVVSLAGACATPPRADVQTAIASIDGPAALAHVQSLVALGPRPAANEAVQEASLVWLEQCLLAELGGDTSRFGGALVLDPVGYTDRRPDSQRTPARIWPIFDPPTTGDFVLPVGNWDSGSLADSVQDALERYTPELECYAVKRLGGWFKDSARSDHQPCWDAGLPAVWLNDFGEFRSPHYHDPSDLPATLDGGFMAGVARAATAWAIEWARAPDPHQ